MLMMLALRFAWNSSNDWVELPPCCVSKRAYMGE